MPDAHIFDTQTAAWGEDSRFPGLAMQMIEARGSHPSLSMVVVRVAPGQGIPPHTHPTETETALVLSGEAFLTTGEQQTVLRAGMGVTIPPGLHHSVRNTGDIPLELLAIHTPPTR